MLIYSSEKEFIGIDERYLRIFGLPDLAALQMQNKDFADFFVKKPGYVHNFQHVHWIDFIDCAESVEESKVMIKINAKEFIANIAITTVYLTQTPSAKSYLIKLNNLRQVSGDTGDEYLVDLPEKEPVATVTPKVHVEPKATPILRDQEITPVVTEKKITPKKVVSIVQDAPDYNIPLDIETEKEITPIKAPIKAPVEVPTKVPEKVLFHEVDDYVFDPKVASEELGLPVDLIEEFIEDFIAQAKEFKIELYDSVQNLDFETIASLSHKLKGVAGNLRVENAYDKLCIINTSKKESVLKNNLDHFYYIVAQLSGEIPSEQATKETKEVTPEAISSQELDAPLELDFDDDDFILDFKDNEDDTELVPLDIDIEPLQEETVEEKAVVAKPTIVVDYSKTVAANEIGLDIETFNELLDDYNQDASHLLTEMRKAVEMGDINICRKKALLLKSMSESMRIKDLTSDLSSIKNASDTNNITMALDNLEAIVKQISE